MGEEKYYGKGGRLSKDANPKLIATAYQHDCEDANELMSGLHVADMAHAIMLVRANLIPEESGKKLIKALNQISKIKIPINPEFGDIYNSKEIELKKTIGDNAGWLHLGRARREAINNGFLFNLKDVVLDFYTTALELIKTLRTIADNNMYTAMTDFTYMLHAQPTSLGHYLGTYITPLVRDCDRLKQYFDRLDQSWAGIGSVNGSRLPIDRMLLSELMGFEKPAVHLRDAMWMPDIMNEGIFILSNLFSGINRFVEELIVWNTHEFGYIDIDDSYARASVIMPQKKNPYPLAYMRGLCSEILGKLTSYLSLGKSASGFPDSRIFIYGDIIRIYGKSANSLDMFSDFMKRVSWNKERMKQSVISSFAYSTDLAETISQHYKVDYKTSHKIVGKAVRELRESKDRSIMDLITEELESRQFVITESIEQALISATKVEELFLSRKGIGATSPESMAVYLKFIAEKINEHQIFLDLHTDFKEKALQRLNVEIKTILSDEFQEFTFTR